MDDPNLENHHLREICNILAFLHEEEFYAPLTWFYPCVFQDEYNMTNYQGVFVLTMMHTHSALRY